MATMPVVWCSDRNSVDDKPTAFALHGIKLEGNVTEKQVLALQNLVAAAAEGRLILPSDGTFVLMDSGISLDGTIIEEHNTSEYMPMPIAQKEKSTFKTESSLLTKINHNNDDDALYEFLCCAKCLNQKSESKCCYKIKEALCENKKENRCMSRSLLQRYFKASCLPSRCSMEQQEMLPQDPLYGIANKYSRRQNRLQRNPSTIKVRCRQPRDKILTVSTRISHNRFNCHRFFIQQNSKTHVKEIENINAPEKENVPQYSKLIKTKAVVHVNENEEDKKETNCDTKDLISFDEIDVNKINNLKSYSSTNEKLEKNNIMDMLTSETNELTTCGSKIELDPKSEIKIIERKANSPTISPPTSPKSTTSSRKTSFDSTCTISSLDSGFIEMQNKLENSIQMGNLMQEGAIKNKIDNNLKEKTCTVNYKECLTQSKNRRRSYEEFKAMFNALSSSSSSAVQQNADGPQEQDATTKTSSLKRFLLEFVKNEKQPTTESDSIIETSSNTAVTPRSILEENQQQTLLDNNIIQRKQNNMCGDQSKINGYNKNNHNYNGKNIHRNNNNNNNNSVVCNKPEFENKFAVLETTTNVDGSKSIIEEATTTTEMHKIKNKGVSSNATTEAMRKNSNFLSLILNQHEVMSKEKEKAQIRRKSYEEFKRLVRECEMSKVAVNDNAVLPATNEFKRQNSRHRKSYASFLLMRRNLANDNEEKTIDRDIKVQSQESQRAVAGTGQQKSSSSSLSNYKRNFKIYDKLVYGTIYDILQRKNDIYNLTYQKYDKYMTYGTIYEILHRKSSQSSLASTQSVSLSQNIASHKRKSLSAILERISKPIDVESEDEISQNILKAYAAPETTPTSLRTYGTIYDILQGDKLNSSAIKLTEVDNCHKSRTRFTVSKIDESQVQNAVNTVVSKQIDCDVADDAKKNVEENVQLIDQKVSKPNKMRRLSNILSYKSTNNSSQAKCEKDIVEKSATMLENTSLLPLDSEEIYTRVIALKKLTKTLEANPIVKSNSLDAISKQLALTPPDSPSPPRPRRSLKQHSNNPKQSSPTKSRGHGKKFSLDSEAVPQLHKRGLKPQQRRRWSNQMSPVRTTAANAEKDVQIIKADTKQHELNDSIRSLLDTDIETMTTFNKKGKSRRLSEFTRGEFLNEKL